MSVGRRRTKDLNLPPCMRKKRKRLYYDHGIEYVNGKPKRKWEPIGSLDNFPEALARWAELHTVPQTITDIASIIQKWLVELPPKKKLAPATVKGYRQHADVLIKAFGRNSPPRLTASGEWLGLRPTHISKYLRTHRAPVLANRQISTFSVICQDAIAEDWIHVNPCTGVRRNTETPRDLLVTDDEHQKVMVHEATHPVPVYVAAIADLTSLRKADVLKILRAAPTGQENGRVAFLTATHLVVQHNKTGFKQEFALFNKDGTPNALFDVIQKVKALKRPAKNSHYLFCTRRGKPYTTSGFDSMWQRLKQKTGVKQTFNDYRGTTGVHAEDQGQDPQQMLGHKVRQTTDRYLGRRKVVKLNPVERKKL